MGIKLGKNVNISPRAVLYNEDMIEIGDNVRIDDFCVLSGGSGLKIGSHIHIAVNCSLFAGSGIVLSDFCNIAAYSLLLSESDNFDGSSMIGPQIPKNFKSSFKTGKIILEEHVSLGARTTILPGVTMFRGSVTGSHTLVTRDCEQWCIYAGTPAKMLKARSKHIETLTDQYLDTLEVGGSR